MTSDGELVEKILAKLACEKGVAIARDDPLIEVVFLNQAVLEHYLALAVAPIKEALAGAVTGAKREVSEHAQAQATYIEQVMLKDRERFVAEQKAALDALDERLRDRDAALVKLMTGILEKARERLMDQSAEANAKPMSDRVRRTRTAATLASLALAVVVGATGAIGGMWLTLHFG